jgi:hypothetical protein
LELSVGWGGGDFGVPDRLLQEISLALGFHFLSREFGMTRNYREGN